MAKKRYINTKFWRDNYVLNLSAEEKLLFLYLFTNPQTDICGIYELPLQVIQLETGLTEDVIIRILKKLEDSKKIIYIEGWMFVINFSKHQAINDKIKQGIKRSLKEVPDRIMAKLKDKGIDYDRLSIDFELLKPKPIPKPKPKLIREEVKKYSKEYAPSLIEDFCLYWEETDSKGRARWEREKTWDLNLRLKRWKRQQDKWDFERSQRFIKDEDKERVRREGVDSGPKSIKDLLR